jgi:pimeloyl-ACP methyl ester carboxylesterase
MKKTILIAFFSLNAWCAYTQPGTTAANGITIAYESLGKVDAPAIILISGAGAPLTNWPTEFCELLVEEGFRVIRFDNRDVGLSTHLDSLGQPDWAALGPFIRTCDKAPLPYTVADMAGDVAGLMDGLSISKAHIVGASMGGAIAQFLTINFPTRVLTLTTIGASSGNPNLPAPDPLAGKALTAAPPSTTNTDSLVTYLVNLYRSMGSIDPDKMLKERAAAQINRSWYPEGRTRQIAAVTIADNCDRRKDLEKVQVPTIVIHGDVDPLVSGEAAKELSNAIAGSQLYIINGMGHDLSGRFMMAISDLIIRNTKRQATSETAK